MLEGEKVRGLRADSREYFLEDASNGRGPMGTFDKHWEFFFGVVNGNWRLHAVESTTFMDRESSMSAFESVVDSNCLVAAAARSFIRARAAALADGDG